MPTGYTADIEKGIDFNTFTLNCARAFGALVTMRDDPADAPIPEEFKPSTYYGEAMVKDESELSRLKGLTREQASAEAKSGATQ